MWLTLLLQNWKSVFGGILIASLVAYGQVMKHQRDVAKEDLRVERNERHAEKIANEAAIQAVKDRSDETLRKINDNHDKLLEQAKGEALEKYIAKYGTGNPACGVRIHRLPDLSNGSAVTDFASSTEELVEGKPAPVLTADFLNRAVEAAVMIHECQTFITDNRIPVDK